MELITYVTNGGKAWVMLHIGAGHSNNCQIHVHVVLKLFRYMTYFAIICSTKKSSKFGGIRGINQLCYK